MPPKQIKKQIKKAAKKVAKKQVNRALKKFPVRRAGRVPKISGKGDYRLSDYFGEVGNHVGKKFGGFADSFINKIIGRGDYNIIPGGAISQNGGAMVPQFSRGRHPVISHREYITDIQGSTQFTNTVFPINPGVEKTFPWLASVAACYEEYRFKGCAFEFRSTSADALNSTNTALGTVIMCTNYDVLDAAFASKLAMENYDMAMSCKPSESMLHGVECNHKQNPLGELYIRGNSLPNNCDPRLYDFGVFQLATVGMQAVATIGELWVTYEIELLKPKLGQSLNYNESFGHWNQLSLLQNVDGTIGPLQAGVGSTAFPFGPVNSGLLRMPNTGSNISGIRVDGSRIFFDSPGTFLIIINHGTDGSGTYNAIPAGLVYGVNMLQANNPLIAGGGNSFRDYVSSSPTGAGSILSNNSSVQMYCVTSNATATSQGILTVAGPGGAVAANWSLMIIPFPQNLQVPEPSLIQKLINRLELLESAEHDTFCCPTPEEKDMSESTVLARALSKLSASKP